MIAAQEIQGKILLPGTESQRLLSCVPKSRESAINRKRKRKRKKESSSKAEFELGIVVAALSHCSSRTYKVLESPYSRESAKLYGRVLTTASLNIYRRKDGHGRWLVVARDTKGERIRSDRRMSPRWKGETAG